MAELPEILRISEQFLCIIDFIDQAMTCIKHISKEILLMSERRSGCRLIVRFSRP